MLLQRVIRVAPEMEALAVVIEGQLEEQEKVLGARRTKKN